jgi:hypothetical protein
MGEGGYVAEFVSDVWIPLMKEIMSKGIKIVTNAGGALLGSNRFASRLESFQFSFCFLYWIYCYRYESCGV